MARGGRPGGGGGRDRGLMALPRGFLARWLAATAAAHLLLALWIIGDARRRGANPAPWALAVLPGGLFALAGWLRRRPPLS